MPSKTIQLSFSGGEIGPSMRGRQDDVKYQNGLQKCRNFICEPQGSIRGRPGFEFVTECGNEDQQVRLITFAYNANQQLCVELGDRYARFHAEGATVCRDNGEVYQISTPWAGRDVMDLHYCQSGDVLTIVHPDYPPTELRRYGATDWRTATVQLRPTLAIPSGVSAVRITTASDDPNSEKYTFKYKVSVLNADKSRESACSGAVSVVANLYAYGTTVRIRCNSVPGAAYYRFYKCVGGIYGYIGDSETSEIVDDNIAPKTDVTPRRYDDAFKQASGIVSCSVTAQGSGYVDNGFAAVGNWRPEFTCSETRYNITTVQGIGGYPELRSSSVNNKAVIDVDSKTGSGAQFGVDLMFELTPVGTHNIQDGDRDWTVYTSRMTLKVTGVRVLSHGSGYRAGDKLVLRLNGTTVNFTERHRWKYSATYTNDHTTNAAWDTASTTASYSLTGPVQLVVSDTGIGTGANLEPVIEGGRITAVRVVNGGKNYSNPTITVRSATGSGASVTAVRGETGDYPSTVGYFEQRRVFAGMKSDPQRVIMTRSATEDDMSYSLPLRDDDRISFVVATREFNPVRHVLPLSHLILLTTGSELRISPNDTSALTPASLSVRPQSYVGANTVQPIIVDNTAVYVAEHGGHIRDIGYSYQINGYQTNDLCLRANHLFDFKEIKDATLCKAPFPIMWFVSSDGGLLGMTYIPAQEVASWHRHETDGAFESCAVVSEGGEDRLYVVVRRFINGQYRRYIERMGSQMFEGLSDAFCVDCGAVYEGKPATTITGLDWLEGKTVSILADGAVMPEDVVTDGEIHLAAPASHVVIGLPYCCDAQTLPCTIGGNVLQGAGASKNIARAYCRVYKTSGLRVGPSFDKLTEYKQRTTEQPGTPPELITGDIDLQLLPVWANDGTICLRQADPLPITLQALVLFVSV